MNMQEKPFALHRFLLFTIMGAIFSTLALPPHLLAEPYNGERTYNYHQPDGSTVPVKLYGDEFFAYQRTPDGREIVKDSTTGFWCYAALAPDGRSFVSTGIPAATAAQGFVPSARIAASAGGFAAPGQTLPSDVVLNRVREAQTKLLVNEKGQPLPPPPVSPNGPLYAPPSTTTTGSRVGLCLLVDFSDSTGTITPAQVNNFCNQSSGYTEFHNACSVRQFFQIQSNGQLDYTNVVTAYIRVPKPKSYYDDSSAQTWGTSKAQELVAAALDGLTATGFDYTQLTRNSSGYITSINLFYAGTVQSSWATGIWPHSWAIPAKLVAPGIYAYRYQMCDMENTLGIGTFCHENGHMTCGYPDLYSYVNGTPIVGYYSLMSQGSWAGYDGVDATTYHTHPNSIDPYLKYKSGWSTVQEITSATYLPTGLPATTNTFIKYTNPADSREYFLLENRDPSSYEGVFGGSSVNVCPGRGLVVWHIFEGGSNTYSSIQQSSNYTTPYEAMIVEAVPTGSYTPWYYQPNMFSAPEDSFYQGHGANPLNDSSFPNLNFWDHTGNTGRTVPSGMLLKDVGAQGTSISLTLGTAVPGSLTVNINPAGAITAGAKWRRAGTSTWLNSGYTESGITSGTYTVEFLALTGWATPTSQSLNVYLGQTVTTSGTYVRDTGQVQVSVTPSNATWTLTDGDGATSAGTGTKTLSALPTGNIHLVFNALSNYTTPAQPTDQVLSSGGSITFGPAAYTRQTGTVNVNVTPSSATWTLTDGDGATTTGAGSHTFSGVPTGSISLALNALNNYTTPAQPAPQTLANGGTITFTKAYTRQTGTVVVNITPSSATWTLTDGDGATTTGAGTKTLTGIPTGYIHLALNALNNYDMPTAPADQTLASGGTVTFTKAFTRQTGTVNINVTPASATWTLTDGDGATSAGTGTKTLNAVPTGNIHLVLNALSNYTAPAQPTDQVLSSGGTITFGPAAYTRQTGTVNVNVTPSSATWTLTDGDGATTTGAGSHAFSGVPTGGISLALNALNNYTTPAQPAPQTLTNGGTVTFTKAYTRQTGTVVVGVAPSSATWILTDGDGATSASTGPKTLAGIPTGYISLQWLTLDTFTTPSQPAAQYLANATTVTFQGIYLPPPGSVDFTLWDGATSIPLHGGPVDLGTAQFGGTPLSKTFTVTTTGTHELEFSNLTTSGGFVISQSLPSTMTAGTSATFTVTLPTTGTGSFNGIVQFSDNVTSKTPFDFQITGNINPVGALKINLIPPSAAAAGAQWRLQSEENWRYSGDTKTGITPGNYIVEFSDVPEFETPVNITVDILLGQTTERTVAYTAAKSAIQVVVDGKIVTNAAAAPVDFGLANLNDTPPQKTVSIVNTGLGTLTLSTLRLPAGFLAPLALPASIAPGTTGTLILKLDTSTAGIFSGDVQFEDNVPGAPLFTFPITGSVLPITSGAGNADFQINYKNCELLEVTSGPLAALSFTGDPSATVKIQRLTKSAAALASNPDKGVLYLTGRTCISTVTIQGALALFNTNASIQTLKLDGPLASLQTSNAFIASLTADSFKTVAMNLQPATATNAAAPLTRLIATGDGTSIKPKVTLNGVGIAELTAPGQTVTITVNAKKSKTGAVTPANVSGTVTAGPNLSITITGGDLTGDILAANIKSLTLKKSGAVGGHLGSIDGPSTGTWIMTGAPDLGTPGTRSATPDIALVNAAAGVNASFVCGMDNTSDDLGILAPTFEGLLKQITVGKNAAITGQYWSDPTTPKFSPKSAGSGFTRKTNATITR